MKNKELNILLVDDNRKFLDSVAERAKVKGFKVFTAENGEAAINIVKNTPIHVAVVDHLMPDMNGLEVMTKLKAIDPDIRTILLTGHGDEKLQEATQALNSAYFDKADMGSFWDFLSNRPLGNINILLVDDNEKFVNTLAERIRLKGYDALIALNGKEALEIARSNKIQMAVVDQAMPEMDGLMVITKLKAIDPAMHTLLLTGHGDDKLREATQALNAAYFEKEDMSKFWSFIRRNLQALEKHLAAAGMASGGDISDALEIESPQKGKKG